MFKSVNLPAIYMGVLAACVGYAASFAIVLAGLSNIGATAEQAATGLFFAALGMGVCSIWLPALTRIPAAVAWSTPGAAFLASTAALPGGFAEAVGAFLVCAGLIFLTGLIPALGRAVAAIPKPVASALLAGVLLKLCLAPALALGTIPELAIPLLIAWAIGTAWNRLAAMPLTVLAFVLLVYLAPATTADAALSATFPALAWVIPEFSLLGAISIGLPLYLVTMAGQNIPGFAVLELSGYQVNRQPMLRQTGLASLAIAPFGSLPVNMSAITAAMMTGPDAGADPKRRYWSAITSGICYVFLAFLAAPVAALTQAAPADLITAMAGLALIPALVASFAAAFGENDRIEAPALTFLIAASGMTLLGINGAFWAVLIGAGLWFFQSRRTK